MTPGESDRPLQPSTASEAHAIDDERDGHPRQCVARSRTGGQCRSYAVKGATVCRMHGGSSPHVRAAAARRLAERKALLAVESFGLPREVDPVMALSEELHRCQGAVDWLGAVVADLPAEEVARSAMVDLWQAERDRLVRVSKVCVDLGLEERRVRVAEQTGQQLAAVMRAVLERLSLTDEQQAAALTVVPEEFRRLIGTTDPAPVLPMPSPGVRL